jgi:SAM-dependent methyltransferase
MVIAAVKRFLMRMGFNRYLSRKRFELMDRISDGMLTRPKAPRTRILDVGCNGGKDLVKILGNDPRFSITGVDLKDYKTIQDNFSLVLADACCLPFPDKAFDLAVSIGAFEHILPLENLALAAIEISRTAKSFMVVVPSISTLIEPHTARPLWQLADASTKKPYSNLIYLPDDAWLAFSGFSGVKTKRFFHLPPFITDLVIYRVKKNEAT